MKQGPSLSREIIQVISVADESGLRLNEFEWILNSLSSIIEAIGFVNRIVLFAFCPSFGTSTEIIFDLDSIII